MAPTRIIYLISTNYILGFDEELKKENHNFVQADAAEAAKSGTLKALVVSIGDYAFQFSRIKSILIPQIVNVFLTYFYNVENVWGNHLQAKQSDFSCVEGLSMLYCLRLPLSAIPFTLKKQTTANILRQEHRRLFFCSALWAS